ncbi:helix-turn-helix domain-containing protein [Chryseobacterium sp.]|uniref:AraC family transcriptional regulator n=1 Tax=Chryseobacterium sp. TaxID=1871047 RepID=UPI0025BFB89A|nr:helix-turn-helix domain-containing protein [Chryseobacterium sp.]
MRTYESLHDTLSFYHINCQESYYISSGKAIFNFPDLPFRIDYYALCICTSGEINIEIDKQKYQIGIHHFFISAPSTIIKFLSTSEDFKMKLLFFDKNFLIKNISNPFIIEKMNLFNKGSYSIVKADDKNAALITDSMRYMKKKTRLKGKFTEEIIRSSIFNLLLEVAEFMNKEQLINSKKKESKKDLFLKFRQLVQEKIQQCRNVQYYADQLFVSNKYLIEIVKKSSGKTPHQIIDETLLREAYVLLGNPDITISEIAFELQFNSASAFGRFFKKHTSYSPSEYRINENIFS